MSGGWRVEADADDSAALAALADDRIWNGYSIADLAPPLRAYTHVALARRGTAPPSATCLFLRHPGFNSTIPHGDPAGVLAILDTLAEADELPGETYVLARAPHLPALDRRYDFPDGRQEMIRMAVDARTFRPPHRPATRSAPPAEPLGPDDLPALQDLYAAYEASAFTADQLLNGVFHGIRDTGVGGSGTLFAAGGTHVVAIRYGIAAVGNIYVRPTARGHGYGSAVTAATVTALLNSSCRDVILNVAVANRGATQLYARLGFHEHCRYWEGQAVRRRATGEERGASG